MDLIVKECDVNGNYSEKEIVQEVATMLGVTQLAGLIYIIAGIINLKKKRILIELYTNRDSKQLG